jgi:hypothetical protein
MVLSRKTYFLDILFLEGAGKNFNQLKILSENVKIVFFLLQTIA